MRIPRNDSVHPKKSREETREEEGASKTAEMRVAGGGGGGTQEWGGAFLRVGEVRPQVARI